MRVFDNRTTAGETLVSKLQPYLRSNAIIYALPRGGVPVAAPVAKCLEAPLSLLFVKKIGAPGHEELAIGAIVDGEEPTQILRNEIIHSLHISELYVSAESEAALNEIERRRALYSGLFARTNPKDRTVIIVDDGVATGASMEVAIEALRKQGAKQVIVAVPVAPAETISKLRGLADDVICVDTPESFWSVGEHYQDFPQLTDADVMETLNQHSGNDGGPSLVRKRA